jgi:hypothetical protein
MPRRLHIVWLLLLGLAAGCGTKNDAPSREAIGNVSGVVLLDGEPLSKGGMLLEKIDRSIVAMSAIDSKGNFTAKAYQSSGLPVGQYRVAVSSTPPGQFGAVTPTLDPNDKVPLRYRSVHTSNLTIDVVEGPNPPVKIDLTP